MLALAGNHSETFKSQNTVHTYIHTRAYIFTRVTSFGWLKWLDVWHRFMIRRNITLNYWFGLNLHQLMSCKVQVQKVHFRYMCFDTLREENSNLQPSTVHCDTRANVVYELLVTAPLTSLRAWKFWLRGPCKTVQVGHLKTSVYQVRLSTNGNWV